MHVLAGFVNRGFLLATSSQTSKTRVESQITLLVWPFAEKQHTINHLIIFNDSISKFHQCSIEAFAEAYLCFLVSALVKKE